ncbi:malto-oligosyltrehalose synthase [Hansschlegelia quercus]|uniref:Malto-oligosyltrehalose synthase n=1 Tax=Hansschlegelia quercus TaxID=2528245 RepID=A0A4Q9GLF8_9HYPH|nr:malto-oligosyltrehalose synthase [Hansschlegelia quercus]TBN53534.1 malto-oligosyltrehalose synthase [Hansschlegelia quercus]
MQTLDPAAPPRATMRLQFHKDFPFENAIPLAPYLKALGVSHLYSSPILTARAGSMHGYDVIDPTTVNPELGGEEGFRKLVAALREQGLGIIVDIVPNHMAVGKDDNAWWLDVLTYGRGSRFGHFFDIDWEPADPALHGKILVPTLGPTYGEALSSGDLKITREGKRGGLAIRYADHLFPLRPEDRQEIEDSGLEAYDGTTPEGEAKLHALLEKQNWRLASWTVAGDEINWRRFFDVNELAGLRIGDPAVFEATHETLLNLYAEGLIDGFRVDHIDGLADPGLYARRLREHLEERQKERPGALSEQPAYLVIEKILGPGERLATDWKVDGASGYDFMDEVSMLEHASSGQETLSAFWAEISGRPASFHDEEEIARREILDRSFSAQLDQATIALHDLARLDYRTRDTSKASIRRALIELLAHFPAYRTYASPTLGRTEGDKPIFATALEKARETILPADAPILDLLDNWLGGEPSPPEQVVARDKAIQRFQQLSAPVAAKAVEDTAFYRYGKLLSRTDVGFDVATFAIDVPTFHEKMQERAKTFPEAMLTTSTHDHKRGEDVRARLAVLSEIPDEWIAAVERWRAMAEPFRDGDKPSAADEQILYQTLVGAWPHDLKTDDAKGLKTFAERIAGWQQKALREAKLQTDWTAPNEAYENAAQGLLSTLLTGSDAALRTDIAAFAARIGPAGAANGLLQMLLKLTVPGVPDIYQGTEFWDLSLVDPDNRRPVDYDARRAALDRRETAATAAAHWADGAVKQAIAAAALGLRAKRPKLFAAGAYVPLEITGPSAGDVVAFARALNDDAAIVIGLRCIANRLSADGSLSLKPEVLQDHHIAIPRAHVGRQTIDLATGRSLALEPKMSLGTMLSLPVCLLELT